MESATTTMPFWAMNVIPHGQCWVEAPDAEAAIFVVRKYYGRSVEIDWVRDDEDRPLMREKLPLGRAFLAEDATWRQGRDQRGEEMDRRPMLNRTAQFLMACGASYEEALEYQIADQRGDQGRRDAVTSALSERSARTARKRELEEAIKKAQQKGAEARARGRNTSLVSTFELEGLLRRPSAEEMEALTSAFRGDQ